MARRVVIVVSHDECNLVGIVGSQSACDISLCRVGYKGEACELFRDASFDNFLCVRVGRRCHCYSYDSLG